MIRITVVSQTEKEVRLKVEGWVSGENVALLAAEGDRHLREAGRLVLDLEGVKFIDRAGIQLLQRWSGQRLVLRQASSFIQALLEAHGLVV